MKRWMTSLALLCLLCGCGAQTLELSAAEAVEKTLSQLGREVTMQQGEKSILRGERYLFLEGEEQNPLAEVYVYADAETAAKEADCIREDGCAFNFESQQGKLAQCTQVDWIAPPHFFLYENAIVQYIGSDGDILTALQALCGAQIAGAPTEPDTDFSLRCGDTEGAQPEAWRSQPAPDNPAVVMEVLPETLDSQRIMLRICNNSEEEIFYDEAFSLLRQVPAEGEQWADSVAWTPVEFDLTYDAVLYRLSAGNQTERQLYLPQLEAGTYRVTKLLHTEQADGSSVSFEVYADFALTKAQAANL